MCRDSEMEISESFALHYFIKFPHCYVLDCIEEKIYEIYLT